MVEANNTQFSAKQQESLIEINKIKPGIKIFSNWKSLQDEKKKSQQVTERSNSIKEKDFEKNNAIIQVCCKVHLVSDNKTGSRCDHKPTLQFCYRCGNSITQQLQGWGDRRSIIKCIVCQEAVGNFWCSECKVIRVLNQNSQVRHCSWHKFCHSTNSKDAKCQFNDLQQNQNNAQNIPNQIIDTRPSSSECTFSEFISRLLDMNQDDQHIHEINGGNMGFMLTIIKTRPETLIEHHTHFEGCQLNMETWALLLRNLFSGQNQQQSVQNPDISLEDVLFDRSQTNERVDTAFQDNNLTIDQILQIIEGQDPQIDSENLHIQSKDGRTNNQQLNQRQQFPSQNNVQHMNQEQDFQPEQVVMPSQLLQNQSPQQLNFSILQNQSPQSSNQLQLQQSQNIQQYNQSLHQPHQAQLQYSQNIQQQNQSLHQPRQTQLQYNQNIQSSNQLQLQQSQNLQPQNQLLRRIQVIGAQNIQQSDQSPQLQNQIQAQLPQNLHYSPQPQPIQAQPQPNQAQPLQNLQQLNQSQHTDSPSNFFLSQQPNQNILAQKQLQGQFMGYSNKYSQQNSGQNQQPKKQILPELSSISDSEEEDSAYEPVSSSSSRITTKNKIQKRKKPVKNSHHDNKDGRNHGRGGRGNGRGGGIGGKNGGKNVTTGRKT